MFAAVGNWLVVRNRLLDQQVRAGQIVEVPHPDGSPPYVVHWLDDERTSVVFPGSDAVVTTGPPSRTAPGAASDLGPAVLGSTGPSSPLTPATRVVGMDVDEPVIVG